MKMRRPTVWPKMLVGSALAFGLGTSAVPASDTPPTVSQKNRLFNPGEISISKGQALVIVNDDGDLMHHAYVDSDTFSFDSGDQKPGSRTSITFTSPGDFKVLCGIHPKMKLAVHVK